MANTTKKYVSLNRLSTFLDNLKSVFATKTELEVVNTAISGKAPSSHTHAVSDVANLQPILDERVNQNAFSYVKVGDTSIAADKATDTLTMVASTNVTITPDATNDKITISAKDTTYSAGAGISLNGTTFSNSGVRSVATGSNNGTISVNTNGSSTNVAVKGLGSAAYTNSTAYDSAGTAKTKADEALASAKTYTDTKISNMVGSSSVSSQISSAVDGLATETYVDNKVAGIVNSAPETLDTLNELATALGNDPNFATTVATQIGTKVDKVSGKGLSTNDYTTTEKNKLSGIASGAEVNQNAFSNVTIGATTIAADSKTDTLTLDAGNNIILTPNATEDKITIAAIDTVYTHPSYTAKTGVPTKNQKPAFGGTFKVSQPVSDATGHITAINSRTITIPSSTATTSNAGLMSASDKTKLDAMGDYVVELGWDNNWNYRRWNSGWLECWRTLSISGYACNTAVGNWYRTSILTPAAYPVGGFDDVPYLQMFFETDTGTGGFVWPAGTNEDANPVARPHKFYIIRMTSSNSISGKIHFYASGWILGSGM